MTEDRKYVMTVGDLRRALAESSWPDDHEVVVGQPQCSARQDRYVSGLFESPHGRCVLVTGGQEWSEYP